ncbi:MAG TPA: DUF222 domain-containing protein [Acidimicrobiia bacterium]|nr:DUF222 domain-containing protein [Acidimicrobiia bacterium]
MVSRAVERLREAIDELAAEDVDGLSQRAVLADLWRELARLDAQFARRLAELDVAAEWSVDGARSAAGWLAAHTRATSGEAHHRVKVARQIAAMPIARMAWERGAIGTSHVAALTKVRSAAGADAPFAVFEPQLVDVACAGRPDDVANVGKQWRDALDNDLDRDGANDCDVDHDRRAVRFSRTVGGVGVLDGTFDTEDAEIIEKALKRSYVRAHAAGDPRTPAQQRSDAMAEIFRHYLDDQPRGTNRPHVIYVVGVDTLSGEAVGLCGTLDGNRVSPETLLRIACDSISEILVVDAKGVPLAMGRTTRTFTPSQYRSIMARDGGCRFPECAARPDDCEAHHARFFEHGGATDVDNGFAACKGRGHHRLIHEGGWTVTGDPNGELSFYDPDGRLRGTTTPRTHPPPILTQAGRDRERTRERVRQLVA